jgi:hypothetical protein
MFTSARGAITHFAYAEREMALVVCEGCNRHVREDTCPFCGARVDHGRAPKTRAIGHATRAMIAFGAAAATAGATSLGACGGEAKSSAIDAAQSDAIPSTPR